MSKRIEKVCNIIAIMCAGALLLAGFEYAYPKYSISYELGYAKGAVEAATSTYWGSHNLKHQLDICMKELQTQC